MSGVRFSRTLLVGLACVFAVAFADTGCAGHDPAAARGPRPVRFDLESASVGALAVDVPAKPVASTPTETTDLTFELYVVKRSGRVVDVVFALYNTGQSGIDLADPTKKLDESPAIPEHAASAIALVDRKGLKEYRTFRENGEEGPCLCSETWNAVGNGTLPAGKRRYYAAVVAAPPAGVTEVTLKAGIADIDSVRIEQ